MDFPDPSGSNSTMQIYGPYRVSTAHPTPAAQRTLPQKPAESAAATSSTPVDQLDLSSTISGVNRMQPASEIAGGGEIRIDRVAEIRRQIASGDYETPEKLDAALDKMLDQFA